VSGLLGRLRALKGGEVGVCVDARLSEFEAAGRAGPDRLFSEMCFCILTANYTAERAIVIQEALGGGFIRLPEPALAGRLKSLGYRFPNARAGYIVEARRHRKGLVSALASLGGLELRHWFACNVKGLGYKEASHFLRNIGYRDYAILDFHIIDILADNGLIARPRTLTPKRYVEIEGLLKRLGKKAGMDMAELDLYLWYMETGKILK
jgi:N-glycosylase/DNA lyase